MTPADPKPFPPPEPPPTTPEPLPLTPVERLALTGLAAAWQLRQLEQQAAEREFTGEVERRLNLPPGSVGSLYTIDAKTGLVHPRPQAPAGNPFGGA